MIGPLPYRQSAAALEIVLLAAILCGGYGARLTAPTVRGEESRLAVAARSMLETGTWSYLQQQQRPYLDRPPLHAASIAAAATWRGSVDRAAIRIPSAIAVALTSLLLWLYTRAFLDATAAWASAIAYPTMLQVLEIGRLGESDALFAFLISASLLLWHLGYTRRWPPALTWATGYAIAALGALAKGFQAPVYFCSATFLWLALRRDWRFLFAAPHLFGVAIFAAILLPWAVAVERGSGQSAALPLGLAVLSRHAAATTWWAAAAHLFSFPFAVIASTLPWSALLLLRAAAGKSATRPRRETTAQFAALCLAIGFVSCWLWPGATRYLLPLYPSAAILVGVAIQDIAAAGDGTRLAKLWLLFARGTAVAMLTACLLVVIVSALRTPAQLAWAQPRVFALLYGAAVAALALFTWRRAAARDQGAMRGIVAAAAAFMVLTMTGVYGNQLQQSAVDAAGAVRRLRRSLPAGARLVSLGPVHHLFAYLYEDPIIIAPRPVDRRQPPAAGTYFCVDQWSDAPLELPFAWRRLATISMARTRTRRSYTNVVVGRVEDEEHH